MLGLTLSVFLSLTAFAQPVGRLVRDVAFTDLEGKPGRLSDYAHADALVVAFTQVGCPLSRKWSATFNALEKEYGPRHVAFLLVNVAPAADLDEMREWVKDRGYGARFVPDLRGDLARALSGKTSTEVFVLDKARTLIFRGPLDDQYGLDFSLPRPRRHYLREALDTRARASYPAPGCVLKVKPETLPEPTFHNRISRILQTSCQRCHRPGESAPFPLVTFKDALNRAGMIAHVVGNGLMPPWFASPKHGHWANDPSLRPEDRDALVSWAAGDAPEGDPGDAPLPIAWTQGWQMGTPDAEISIPKPIAVPATGVMPYQYVVVKNPFGEDKWIEAMEIRLTAPEVVHHVLVLQRKAGQTLSPTAGVDGFFAAMVPGSAHAIFPAGVGRFLSKDSELIFQIHYTPNGTATQDQPKLGIRFSRRTPKYEIFAGAAFDTKFVIPAHEANHRVVAEKTLPGRARLFSFLPHLHLRGKAFRYEAIYPDGRSEILLDVPRYDFNWQLLYELKRPLDVPAGTKIRATAWYDNSAANPANPDPTIAVGFGEQTHEEMMVGYFNWHTL